MQSDGGLADAASARAVCASLGGAAERLGVHRGPRRDDPEGRRGAQITHGFYPPAELETLKSGTGRHDEVAEVFSAKRLEADSVINDRVTALEARVRELAEQLESLRKAVGG